MPEPINTALGDETFCLICASFQPCFRDKRLKRAKGSSTMSPGVARLLAALGTPESPSSNCCRAYLCPPLSHRGHASALPLQSNPQGELSARPSHSFPYETQDELEPALGIAEEDEGAISWVPLWDGDFLSLKWASAQRYPWMLACPISPIRHLCLWRELQPSSTFPGRQQLNHAGPSLGQDVARHIQPVPASPDFLEEVRTSWEHPALTPSVLKQAAQLASLEGAKKLGMVGFPPVDSTITALVKAPPYSDP
ncbi:UNVERIFIED_CONTAM: hypothetical protein FKN15_024058 [Acipenser sinensis]